MEPSAVLRPKPPFRVTLHLRLFTRPGRPTPALYDPGTATVTVAPYAPERPVPFAARVSGEPWRPRVEVWAPRGLAGRAAEAAARYFRVGLDYNGFLRAVEGLPQLLRVARRYVGVRPTRALSLYDALVASIVRQRISLRAANTVLSRLVSGLGARHVFGGFTAYSVPPPSRLAAAPVSSLRGLGLTRVKAEALREVAAAQLEGRLPSPGEAEADPGGVASELTRIRGVGPWTAKLAVAMAAPLSWIGPYEDLSVVRGAARVLGVPPRASEVRRVLARLGRYGGLAMYVLSLGYELGV